MFDGRWLAPHCPLPDTGRSSAESLERDVSPTGAGPGPTPNAWLGSFVRSQWQPGFSPAPCLSAEDVQVSSGFRWLIPPVGRCRGTSHELWNRVDVTVFRTLTMPLERLEQWLLPGPLERRPPPITGSSRARPFRRLATGPATKPRRGRALRQPRPRAHLAPRSMAGAAAQRTGAAPGSGLGCCSTRPLTSLAGH